MSLSAVLTTMSEFVADVIVNECGHPVGRVVRYHGPNGLPQDDIECNKDGTVAISWARGFPYKQFPVDAGSLAEPLCVTRPGFLVAVTYDVCWTVPKVSTKGVTLPWDTWDGDAGGLADVAECVARWLVRLGCGKYPSDEQYAQALIAATGGDVRYRETVPTIGGGAARIIWRATVGVAA